MAEYPIINNKTTSYNKLFHHVKDNKKNILNSVDNTLYQNSISFTTEVLNSTKLNDTNIDDDIIILHKNNVTGTETQSETINSIDNSLSTQKDSLDSVDNTLYQNSIFFSTETLTSTKLNDVDIDDDIITLHNNNVIGTTTQSNTLTSTKNSLSTQSTLHDNNVTGTTTQSNKLNSINSSLTTLNKNVTDRDTDRTNLATSIASAVTDADDQFTAVDALMLVLSILSIF